MHAQVFRYTLDDYALVLQECARPKLLMPTPFDPVFVPPLAAGIGFLGFRHILVKRTRPNMSQIVVARQSGAKCDNDRLAHTTLLLPGRCSFNNRLHLLQLPEEQ